MDEATALVQCEYVLDAISQMLGDIGRVIAEDLAGLRRAPAAKPVLERLRQVPMIERQPRLDAVLEELVDQAVVEVEPLRVRLAVAVRKQPRPGHREAIGLAAELPDERDVLLVAVIVLVGAVAGAAVLDLAGDADELVPDRDPSTVLIDRALDLIGRGRRAPDEARRKAVPAPRRRCGLGVRPQEDWQFRPRTIPPAWRTGDARPCPTLILLRGDALAAAPWRIAGRLRSGRAEG